MLFKALSAAVYGIDANLIDVEVDYSGAVTEKDIFHTVGLPDAAVRERRGVTRTIILALIVLLLILAAGLALGVFVARLLWGLSTR